MKKLKLSAEEKKRLLEEYSKSGLSKTQFCKEKKFPLPTFYKFARKQNFEQNKSKFISVSIEDSTLKPNMTKTKIFEKIILKMPSEFYLELPESISTQWLSSLLKELI